jgi:hypothetical protein
MRISTFFITLAAAGAVGVGAYSVGHAASQPAKQLDPVSQPGQAAGVTAEANLTAAVSAAASYRFDHGTYAGMTTRDLRSYEKDIAPGVSVKDAAADGYCVESTVRGATVSIKGPDGTFVASGC